MPSKELREAVNKVLKLISPDSFDDLEFVRSALREISPMRGQPIDGCRWVPIDELEPNSYNPNAVASAEMKLLHLSMKLDGVTQPIVTMYDSQKGKYVIIDGFHRYFILKNRPDISESCRGMAPIVVISKSINDRMASTIRHNRARGEHSVGGMSSLVFRMLDNGWSDAEICNNVGVEPEELLKLKHLTGFSKLFEKEEYALAWETRKMLRIKQEYREKHPEEFNTGENDETR